METEQGRTNHEQLEELAKYIEGMKFAMLTTVDPDGCLRSRPMAVREDLGDGFFWFFTKRESGKVHSIEADRHVNLAFSDESSSRWISIAGRALLEIDREKIRELWSPSYLAWFPGGIDDPDLALIRVEPESAEVWDAPAGRFRQIFGMAKAALTGQRPNLGQRKRMDLELY